MSWSKNGGYAIDALPFAKPVKSRFTKYRMPKHAGVEFKHIMFVDLETTGLITHVAHNGIVYDHVPSVYQIAMIVYNFDDFMTRDILPDTLEVCNISFAADPKSYSDTFQAFVKKYDNPLVVAHNGLSFDFKILLAKNAIDDIRLFDSYVAVKDALKGLPSYKNSNLFLRFADHYSEWRHLVAKAHDALVDCRLTAFWLHHLRDRIAFDHFCCKTEALANWTSRQKRLLPPAPTYNKIKSGQLEKFIQSIT